MSSVIDCEKLSENINPKKRYPLEPHRKRLVKVAYDVVRFVDSENLEDLWKVECGDDGAEYIVAMYDQQGITNKQANDWQVIGSEDCLQIFYKNNFVTKLALNSIGLNKQMAARLYPDIEKRLAQDKHFVESLLKVTSGQHVKEIINKFPELKLTTGK